MLRTKSRFVFLGTGWDTDKKWAVHVTVEEYGVEACSYPVVGYLGHYGNTFDLHNKVVIHRAGASYELSIVGEHARDCDGCWMLVNADNEDSVLLLPVVAECQRRLLKESLRERKRKPIPRSLRYAVLERDGFCCRYCGVAAGSGITLHVDHIVPVSKGGTDEPSNLCAACDTCNLGKGNRHQSPPPMLLLTSDAYEEPIHVQG